MDPPGEILWAKRIRSRRAREGRRRGKGGEERVPQIHWASCIRSKPAREGKRRRRGGGGRGVRDQKSSGLRSRTYPNLEGGIEGGTPRHTVKIKADGKLELVPLEATSGNSGPAASAASLQGREDIGGEGGDGRGVRDQRSFQALSNMEGFFNMVRSSVGFQQDQINEPRGDVQPAYPRSENPRSRSRQVLLHP